MLDASGEKGPYLLVGHPYGELIVVAFADLYPGKVSGLILLDAQVALPDSNGNGAREQTSEMPTWLADHLAQIRTCLALFENGLGPTEASAEEGCIELGKLSILSSEMARVEKANQSSARFWRAYLSEAECNYSGINSAQAKALLPHKWGSFPVRVVIASISSFTDARVADAFGFSSSDGARIAEVRQNRAISENRQAQVCDFSANCQVIRIPTANHMVHDADPGRVVHVIRDLKIRRGE
jgi:pimeloyl-ACP methyl ester carboxylesterase